MLEIHNVEGLDNDNLNINRRKTKKNQILLYDTGRRADDFINKLKYRKNGKFSEVPHFIVTKLGTIYQLYDTNHYSNTFGEPKIDKQFIKIAIENLGWLSKNTITGFLNNWIGDPYRSEPFVRNWRNYYFWDRYNDGQLESISKLCNHLCELHTIPPKIVSSQGYLENAIKFNGVVCKSNFSNIYTDINPSFNFRIIFKNEQQETDII
jgi:N-acetyl-anhydromuramyl-L-alanine amidase AmpD